MFNRIMLPAACMGAGMILLTAAAEVQQVEVTPEIRFRAKTFARESYAIINPVPWPQFREMIPEGTRVKKNDMVFHLDVDGVQEHIEELKNQLEAAGNASAQRLAEMQKTVSELEDKRAEKEDQMRIQLARKTYLTSLPVEADVEIARGRLEVARKKLAADEEELAKSRLRLEKGLISPAMLQEDEYKAETQRAQTQHAEQMLRLAELPAHELEVEVVEYLIRNLELEIGKLDNEIPIQRKILEIETATQNRRIADLKSQLSDSREELKNEFLYAPANGVLIYSPQLKRELTAGGRPSKGMELAEIPKRESIALEGVIPEQIRHLFSVGDPAHIVLNIFPGRSFRGKVSSIAPFSRDAVEGENSSGVKIVDITVEMTEIPETLPIGVYGWVTVSTQRPKSGWAVPASWVRYRGGKAHVSVDGKLEPVNGIIHEDLYLLSSPHPPVENISEEGDWQQAETPGIELITDRFIATGELTPFERLMISTPRVRAWDIQVEWLVEENSEVKEGDALIRLSSEQIEKDLENRTLDVERLRGDRESAEEELAIRISEKEFQLGSSQNRIEIRKRERDLVKRGVDSSSLIQARLNLTQANIQLAQTREELARSERNAEWTSASEREKLKRELRRRELQVERAEIRYQQAREGADAVQKSQAELDLLREKANAAELEAKHYRSLSRAQSTLRWRKAREEREVKQLQRQKEDLRSMDIKAPAPGLVKYLKIWDGVRSSKIKSGMKVWRGMHLLSLSSADQLYAEVSVPERYLQYLKADTQVSVRIPSEGGMQWNGQIIRMEEILEAASQTLSNPGLYGNQEAPTEQVLKIRILIETGEETSLKPGAIAQIIFPFKK